MDKNEAEKNIEHLKNQNESEHIKIRQNAESVFNRKNLKIYYSINSSNTKPYDISKMTGKSDSQGKKEKEEEE